MLDSYQMYQNVNDHIRQLAPSERVATLHAQFLTRYQELGRRIYWESEMVAARDRALLDAYRATIGQPPIIRRARVLQEFAETLPIHFPAKAC